MQSCIYEGWVKHTRTMPVVHRFRYRVFMMYMDLDELPDLFNGRWFWSCKRAALARFRRSDHIGDEDESLPKSVRDLVEARVGQRPSGPIRLLTNLSHFGYCFNPVSFFYCFDTSGKTVETIVVEVNNTPWGEQKTYVLPKTLRVGEGSSLRFQPKKNMHVSPFMPMDVDYDWSFSSPGARASVYMANERQGQRLFSAALLLDRVEISSMSLARVLTLFPFMTFKVVLAIYWQALRLWLKRCPLYAHPDKKKTVAVRPR